MSVLATHPMVIAASRIFVAGSIGTLLYFAHNAFIPIALAMLLWLVLSGPVEALHRRGIPRGASALIILFLALTAIGGAVAMLWTPTHEWFLRAPETMATIKQKVGPLAKFLDHLDELRRNATTLGSASHAGAATQTAAAGESAPALIFDATAAAIAAMLTFVAVTLFLLAGGPPMFARMTAALVNSLKASHVLNMIERVRAEVGHFYLATSLINIALGTLTGLGMWACGMPTPYLWGALAAILNFVPYAGAITTLFVLTLVAMVSFGSIGHVLGVVGTYLLLATLEGQVAQPLLVGRRLQLNPLLIFLGLWFGGLFWGIAGIILATPLLVTLKVIAESGKASRPIMEFMGPNDQTAERDIRLLRFIGRA
jgi:predicted PurR-regulated permease PerM